MTKEEEEAAEEEEDGDDDDDDDEVEAVVEAAPEKPKASKRKRKGRGEDDDDLEGRYFDKLEREIDGPAEKRAKRAEKDAEDKDDEDMDDADDKEDEDDDEDDDDDAQPIIHESLLNNAADAAADDDDEDAGNDKAEQDVEKASRTVFLSNVSIKAVTEKASKRKLTLHLESINGVKVEEKKSKKNKKGKKEEEKEEKKEEGKKEEGKKDEEKEKSIVESIRFRSVPFASAALPKRAAYITGATMGATAQSANAYVVYATVAQARLAVKNLNGTVILDRHLRADSVAHPSPVDHRRCVFVGNLGFVDDETVLAANGEGEQETKKRNKTPMDVEEGLWRTFGKHAGRVESVRVVRDPVTRVGKGIAYVQFYDGTAVEAALLLAEKKFPPLLPRALRVSRCKAPHKTARAMERVQLRGDAPKRDDRKPFRSPKGLKGNDKTGYQPKATAEQQTQAGRAAKLLGRQAATGPGSTVVFEGMRARVGGVSLFKKNKHNKNDKTAKPGAGKPAPSRRTERAKSWKGKPARGGSKE